MNQRQYFDLGRKLIGLYFLVWAVAELLGDLDSTILAIGGSRAISGLRRLFYAVTSVARILVAIIGLYMIRSRSLIRWFAFREEDNAPTTRTADYFTVGVKLYGIILVVGTIPDFLRVLSAYLFF